MIINSFDSSASPSATMPFEPYTLLHTLAGSHLSGVNVVAFSPCGRYLASGSNDKSIIIWDPISGKSL